MSVSDWVQVGVALFGVAVLILGVIAKNLIDLNKNVLVIVERVDSHEKRIDRLESVTQP